MDNPQPKQRLPEWQKDEASGELDVLFAKARQCPPSGAQLAAMLRAVPSDRSRVRRIVVRLVGAGLAAAAVIGTAVLIVAPPGQPHAFAFSDVAEAMRNVRAVKTLYAGGHVAWTAPNRFHAWVKDHGRQAWFHDLVTCEVASWSEESGCVLLSTSDRWSDLGFEKRQDLVEMTDMERIIYDEESRGMNFEEKWTRESVVENGRRMILLHSKDSTGPYYYHYGIDEETRRLVWAKGYEGRLEFEYPESPPNDIYDLGVPRDTRVVDGRATPELLEMRDRVLAAMRATGGYGSYRMMLIRTGKASTVELRASDGRRFRRDSIPLGDERELSVDDLRPLATQYLRHDLSDRSFTGTISDGSSDTSVWPDNEGRPNRRVVEPTRVGSYTETLFFESWRRVYGLFFHAGGVQQLEFLPSNERGWVGIRMLSQAETVMRPGSCEDWFDPQHGYLPANRRNCEFPSAPWQLRADWHQDYVTSNPSPMVRSLPDAPPECWEDEVLEWAQLREGQWYPTLLRGRELIQNQDGEWVERTEPRYGNGFVSMGQIVRPDPGKARPEVPDPAVRHTLILAEPLDEIRDEWFEIPPEWLDLPVERY